MDYYAGLDVSLEQVSVCVVDGSGAVIREDRVSSTPEGLTDWFTDFGREVTRIGLEAGPLSQWLYAGLRSAGLAAELIDNGILIEPDSREPWFLCEAHADGCLDETLDKFERAVDITLHKLGAKRATKRQTHGKYLAGNKA